MAVQWTDEQRKAIEARPRGGGILVSAAAGSGKTAVLVERVIGRILNDGMSIDKLLVVTFTEAAASEMRDKIIRRMYKALADCAAQGKDASFIKKQIQLSVSADIMTIDSFCLRVLKNNYYVLGVDPDFRIADDAESELLADDALEAVFGRLYRMPEETEEGRKFNHLLNIYATNRSDDNLKALILRIYRFTQSFAEPIKWLDKAAAMYDEDMEKSVWMRDVVPELYIRRPFTEYYEIFSEIVAQMLKGTLYDGGKLTDEDEEELTLRYGEMARGALALKDTAYGLMNAKSWAEASDVYKSYVNGGYDDFDLRSRPKDFEADLDDWKYFCKLRNDYKKKFLSDCAAFETADVNKLLHGGSLKRLADEIVWLVKEFDAEFERRKEVRNAKGFSDVEHLVYRLFEENERVRGLYREKYDEILIDEYQDTNGLQDSIFTLISRGGENLFMVGDLKQSIYRFRGGDPTIFKGKSRLFGAEETPDIRISLSQNFRSRQEILRSVNDVFERVMSERLGDVDYMGKEKISRLSDAGERDDMYKSEAHFVIYNKGKDDELTAMEAEADFIADRIRQMIDDGFIIEDGGERRPLKSRDICILSRSVRNGTGSVITSALKKRGINSYVEIEDYFEKREVRLMMSLISVIDNNLQDIPLTAVMRSPIGGFSDNDLARIRIYTPAESLYNAVRAYRSDEDGITGEEIALKIKCRRLVKNLEKWRGYVKRKSVANLIWSIYEETGLYDFMGAFEGGEESQANLRLLYERAKQYEQSGFKGLFNFIKYIDKLKGRQSDLSSANLIGEGHDVVRIMTIHKSKGLEFPVVFIMGMGRHINPGSGGGAVQLHKELGIGLRYADAEAGYFEKTPISSVVAAQNRREDLSEAMRLLYVAMTRPKCKLITVASMKFSDTAKKTYLEKADEQIEKWTRGVRAEEAMTYADWVYPAAIRSEENWTFETRDYVVNPQEETEEDKPAVNLVSDELREVIKKSFEYEYEYSESGHIPSKTSVTALKQKCGEEFFDVKNTDRRYEYDPIYMEEMPAFMRDKKRGAQVGTAHHQVMAFIDIAAMKEIPQEDYEEFVIAQMRRIADEGQIDRFYYEDEAMRKAIAKHIAGFFRSGIGRRVIGAEKVYREQPFQIEIGADVYDETLGKKYGDEKVILQGVIDCFFENGNGFTLIDYKTDRCSDDESVRAVADRYAVQLRLYADAIERITAKPVTEKYLYLFAVNREISME